MSIINTFTAIPSYIDTSDISVTDWLPARPYTEGFSDHLSLTWGTFRGTAKTNNSLYVKWGFDLSTIPASAVIDSVSVTAKVYLYVSSDSYWPSNSNGIQLCVGSYSSGLRGSAAYFSARSTVETLTISAANAGSYTRADLDNLWLVTMGSTTSSSNMTYAPQYRMYGATLTVEYHTETNYNIVANKINCITNPSSNTIEAAEGSYTQLKIYPNTGYSLRALYDDGVNVVNNATLHADYPQFYDISNDSDSANYGFTLVDDYYHANNGTMIKDSYALCTCSLDLPLAASFINVYLIHNVEDISEDISYVSAMDGQFTADENTESSYYWHSTANSTGEQLIQFTDVSAGAHQFDIKFIKNSDTNTVTSVCKFRVEVVMAAEYSADMYYLYVVENLQADRTLYIVCDVEPEFTVTANCSPGGTITNPGSNTVSNGDVFYINIVPRTNYSIAHVLLNSVVTSYTQVNSTTYRFTIPVVLNDANIYVTFTPGSSKFHLKENGAWQQVVQAYKKVNGSWEEIEYSTIGDPYAGYIRMN